MKNLFTLFFLFLTINLTAQIENFIHYGVEEGLPQGQITYLFQDSKGYIWISTKGGVSRFDGMEFKNYDIQDGLLYYQVYRVMEDSKHTIWVENRNGLNKLEEEHFVRFPLTLSGYITYSTIDNNDVIWFLKYDGPNYPSLYKFENEKYQAFYYKDSIFNDAYNLFYNKSLDRLYFYNLSKPEQSRYIQQDSVYTINKAVYMLDYNNKYGFLYNNLISEKKKKDELCIQYKDSILVIPNSIFARLAQFTSKGDVVFTSTDGNPSHIRYLNIYKNGKVEKMAYDFEFITALLIDKEDNIWVGTEKGLFRIVPFNNYTEKSGIPSKVWSIVEDKNQTVWFASLTNTHLYYLESEQIKRENSFSTENNRFYMGAICRKSKGLVFTSEAGIIEQKGKTFQYRELKLGGTFSILEDENGKDIYYGCRLGLLHENETGKSLNPTYSLENKGIVLDMDKNQKAEICFAAGKGIGWFKGNDTVYIPATELGIVGPRSLVIDKKDNWWLGCSGGFYFFDKQKRKATRIEHPELKSSVMSALQIDFATIMVGGLRGIALINIDDFYKTGKANVRFYGKSQGFEGTECEQNASMLDSKGRVWVATATNVVMFKVKDLTDNPYPPILHFNSVETSIDNKNWGATGDTSQFDYRHQNIRFKFIGINHTAPDKVLYSYKLEGYDKQWSEADYNRTALYTNLDPGNYSFLVKASNNSGLAAEKVLRYDFSIIPAWWQRKSVQFLAFILSLALVSGAVFWELNNKRKQEKALRLIAEKEALLAQDEAQMADLRIRTNQALIAPHFMLNSLTAIGSITRSGDGKVAYKHLVNFSRLMRKAIFDSYQTTKKLGDEIGFIEKYLLMQKLRFGERFTSTLEIEENLNRELEIPPSLIFHFIENAIKHGLEPLEKDGELHISLKNSETGCLFTIEDNGIGRAMAKEMHTEGTGVGQKLVNDQIHYYNVRNTSQISFQIIDKYEGDQATGTKVEIEVHRS
jgi:anti-sigma regulatory factor (Ser/Thr protein kinase)